MGNNVTDSLVVGFDSTPPDVQQENIHSDVPSKDPNMPYSSKYVHDGYCSGNKSSVIVCIHACL